MWSVRVAAVGLLAVVTASACAATQARPSLEPQAPTTTATSRAPATVAVTATVPTTAPKPSGSFVTAACGGKLHIETTGQLPADLDEVSGIAASRRHKGLLWVIEDSGNPATVTGIGYDGAVRVSLRLIGAPNVDWEDISLGPGPDGRDWIYVADIGDNFRFRDHINVYRFAEPDAIADAQVPASQIEKIEARYPTGALDSEALTVDPWGTIWVLAKVKSAPATLFRLDRATSSLVAAGTPLALKGEEATALDLSADGAALLLRTYGTLQLYPVTRLDGDRPAPCLLPAPPEPQGESAGFLYDRDGIVTVSEAGGEGRAAVHLLVPA